MPSDPTPEPAGAADHGAADALARVARLDAPRVLSVIATKFNDVDLADDAVQDALADALRTWPSNGVPDNPGGWLMTVAQRRAIDVYRKRQRDTRRVSAAAHELDERRHEADVGGHSMIDDNDAGVQDQRLRLMLLCCHPALDRETQVALTLRLVGGLTVAEISRAFLVPEPTLAQRIVRAKRKINVANMALTMPDNIDERLDAVLTVLYLVFNEGYLAHGDETDPVRADLIDEAIRLTEVVAAACPASADTLGLLALERFHRARTAGRFDSVGGLVLLAEQDRSVWDLPEIEAANAILGRAMMLMQPGRFQVEATIAAQHANSRTAAETDWPRIAALYSQLLSMTNSPVVALNHAVAVAEADGPLAGLALLGELDRLDDYHLFHAVRAELLQRSGQHDLSLLAADRARALAPNGTERRHLAARFNR